MRRSDDVIKQGDAVRLADNEDLHFHMRGAIGTVVMCDNVMVTVDINEYKYKTEYDMPSRVIVKISDITVIPSKVYLIGKVAAPSINALVNYVQRRIPAHMEAFVFSRGSAFVVIGVRDDEGNVVEKHTATVLNK